MDAIEGEDSDEFGAKIFDFSKNGCNLKIKVERQGDFPTYVSSRFAAPSKIPDMTDSGAEELYENVTDLESVFPVRSDEEMNGMLDEHFYCGSEKTDGKVEAEETWGNTESKTDDVDPLDDDKVKELLDGLGDE